MPLLKVIEVLRPLTTLVAVLFFATCASVWADPVEDDWARQDALRGGPSFAKWKNPEHEVRQVVAPAIRTHLQRGRMLLAEFGELASGPGTEGGAALGRLIQTCEALLAARNYDPAPWNKLYRETRWAVRRLAFSHPAWNFEKLLFVKRPTYTSSHIYTDHYDGSTRFGGNLCLLSPIGPEGKVTELAPELAGGIFGRFDLSFDAGRVVFAYKKPGKGYRIFELEIKDRVLRQLTHDGADEAEAQKRFDHGYDDLDPCYLPDGRIIFSSTRSRRAVICTPNFTSTALHVMDGDGGNLHCLSGNTINEFTPCLMHDGRVLYTRWEYVDKGAGDVQSLWSMHPDGSHPAHVYKNNVPKPPTLIDARQLPGSNHRILCIGAPHMPLAAGPVMLVDLRKGVLNPAALTNLTPEIALPLHYGYPGAAWGFFKEPFPLSDQLYLVAYHFGPRHDEPAGYGLYLLDATGHRELIYRDSKISCWQPIPLRSRIAPPKLPSLLTAEEDILLGSPQGSEKATLLMANVYAGMTGIERGRVKYVRVMEDVPKPWEASWCSPDQGDTLGLQNPAVSLQGHFVIKRVHGLVPVNEDGSAVFRVPPGKNLYFQALDSQFMELQRMRTFVNLMPGEKRSCIGCHEPRNQAPGVGATLAMKQGPRELQPQPGETAPRMVHYPVDVQPTFDRYCVSCHNSAKQDGGLNLSGEMTTLFCISYESLIHKRLINHIDSDPRDNYIPAEPPLTFGSHRSKLVQVLLAGHHDARLKREEFIRLVTWIDANAPYYGIYEGKKNLRWKGSPDFRPAPGLVRSAPGRPNKP